MACLLSVSLVVGLVLAAGPYAGTAHALCASIPNVEESLEDSQAVFSGEVIRDGLKDPDPGDDEVWGGAELRVDRSWKGVSRDSVVVYSQDPAYSSLGYRFEKGRSYLVYANRYGDDFRVDECTRTTTLASADKDLRILDPTTEQLTDTGGLPLPPAGALVGAAGLLSAGLILRWVRS